MTKVNINVDVEINDILEQVALKDIIEYYGKEAIVEGLGSGAFILSENLDEEYKIELFTEIINKYSLEDLQNRLK